MVAVGSDPGKEPLVAATYTFKMPLMPFIYISEFSFAIYDFSSENLRVIFTRKSVKSL